ncbi:UNVERIFIED_CONTAM: Histone chaperone asf1 [Siphonaria sp. JEL0065]|nr:Histone chaperone asf1 [Siphonaria sp. JEL0065]
MSIVNLTNVTIQDNPSTFFHPFRFEITFEVISELQEDLEFKLIYVGSPESEAHDQVLEELQVGPVPVGVSKFVFEAPAPKAELLPATDIIGVTVVLLQVSYREKEFIRVGYYVNTDYRDEALRENPPPSIEFNKLERSILADKPRVTRYNIPWDMTEEEQQQQQQQLELQQQQQQGMMNLPFKPDFAHIDTSVLMNQPADPMAGFGGAVAGVIGGVPPSAVGENEAMDM